MSYSGPDSNNSTMLPSRNADEERTGPSYPTSSSRPSITAYPQTLSDLPPEPSYMNTQHPNWPRSHLLSSSMSDQNAYYTFPETHNAFGASSMFHGLSQYPHIDPNGDSARPRSCSYFDVPTMSAVPSDFYIDRKPMLADQVGEVHAQHSVELGNDYSYGQGYYPNDMSQERSYHGYPCNYQAAVNSNECRGLTLDNRLSEEPKKDVAGQDKDEPYAKLIYRALIDAPDHQMVLRDIYEWFQLHTDKAQDADAKGWQNSIRHNLSMNGAFQKVDNPETGDSSKKGFLWRLTQEAINDGGVKSTTRYRSKQPQKRRGGGTLQRLASESRNTYDPRRSTRRLQSPFSSPIRPVNLTAYHSEEQSIDMPQYFADPTYYDPYTETSTPAMHQMLIKRDQQPLFTASMSVPTSNYASLPITPPLVPSYFTSDLSSNGVNLTTPATPSDMAEASCPSTPDLLSYPTGQMGAFFHLMRHPQSDQVFGSSDSGDEGPPTPEEVQGLLQLHGHIPEQDEKYYDCAPTGNT
ncbi:hypothetical protein EJ05DRAFT_118443 [Pseudovirgaria hyperparasitica]|uniref:Fork-head domain-containing protein n=1 Tax=Pseudovirgaria hyperparasitica TaxID=470096 RepID=A0A6A6VWM2_9PEZI|nr:uncharacterized protein EJ05DRAFT_118443 [Pseudovirgaria hyperparasitica]KAF2754992.1 hypothetical protein EJ05DRAFT_118443 [Pseudovirgaria hyperparasitica]